MADSTDQLQVAIEENKKRLSEIQDSVEKIRSYIFWAFVAVVVSFVLPLVGMIFVIPMFLNRYAGLM